MRERRVFVVLGHFERKVGARKARTPCCGWRSLDFDNSAVSKQEVDAKLDAWEVQGARIRKEARRLQPEGTAET